MSKPGLSTIALVLVAVAAAGSLSCKSSSNSQAEANLIRATECQRTWRDRKQS